MRFLFIFLLIPFFVDAQITNESLPINSPAPIFEGVDQNGDTVKSANILTEQDYLVVIFYRGSWCGYCQKHLSEIQDSIQLLLDKNAAVVAVTPETNESMEKMIGKSGATFSVIHDKDYSIMEAFNVDYKITKETVTKFYGPVVKRTAEANGNDEGVLPIPATYIIDKSGNIVWAHFDADYSKRSSVDGILKVIESK